MAAHSAAQELLDTSADADDGFHLEDFQVRFRRPNVLCIRVSITCACSAAGLHLNWGVPGL